MLKRIPEGDTYDSRGLSASETPGTATPWLRPCKGRMTEDRILYDILNGPGSFSNEERDLWD
jgi:hypothetical protein